MVMNITAHMAPSRPWSRSRGVGMQARKGAAGEASSRPSRLPRRVKWAVLERPRRDTHREEVVQILDKDMRAKYFYFSVSMICN